MQLSTPSTLLRPRGRTMSHSSPSRSPSAPSVLKRRRRGPSRPGGRRDATIPVANPPVIAFCLAPHLFFLRFKSIITLQNCVTVSLPLAPAPGPLPPSCCPGCIRFRGVHSNLCLNLPPTFPFPYAGPFEARDKAPLSLGLAVTPDPLSPSRYLGPKCPSWVRAAAGPSPPDAFPSTERTWGRGPWTAPPSLAV